MSKLSNLRVIESDTQIPTPDPVVQPHDGLASLFTVDQLVSAHPNLFPNGKSKVEWWLRNRRMNGFESCVIGEGKTLLIDANKLYDWLTKS